MRVRIGNWFAFVSPFKKHYFFCLKAANYDQVEVHALKKLSSNSTQLRNEILQIIKKKILKNRLQVLTLAVIENTVMDYLEVRETLLTKSKSKSFQL